MTETAIKVENISKAYRIGLKEQRHDTLGATIGAWVKSPFKNFKQLKSLSNFNNQQDEDIFWASKDINFEVKKGEVLGIIGKNGAGKSTLLKILSRITEPTTGRIEIYGRVASLLEVGTGFNPELSGRENVYLNGTILGMTKKEIDNKFDEIIAFSGVEKFIDTPVKRYSSGMKVRLAFSVAAHLDPEILIIDEVLAVGDAEFQRKCLGKMKDVAGQGRTVLFVSHNMAAVGSLCTRAIVLQAGRLVYTGSPSDAISFYLKNIETVVTSRKVWDKMDAPGNSKAKLLRVEAMPLSKDEMIMVDKGLKIEFEIECNTENQALDVSYNLNNEESILMFHHGNLVCSKEELVKGKYILSVVIPPYILSSGEYSLDVWMGMQGLEKVMEKQNGIITFFVEDAKIDHISVKTPGVIKPLLKYDSVFINYVG